MIICKSLDLNNPIVSLSQWKSKCPPARINHWKKGRSAYELSAEWINNNGALLRQLLANDLAFQGTQLIKGSPEVETRIDKYGRGRVHDLLIVGDQSGRKIVISIEAKVDESFGNDTISSYYCKNIIKKLNNKSTKVPNRIEDLIKAIFPKPYSTKTVHLKYQLLHAIAGALVESKKQDASKALFVVHTFNRNKLNLNQKENDKKLNEYINILSSGKHEKINYNQILGPFKVKGNSYIPSDVELFIGKI